MRTPPSIECYARAQRVGGVIRACSFYSVVSLSQTRTDRDGLGRLRSDVDDVQERKEAETATLATAPTWASHADHGNSKRFLARWISLVRHRNGWRRLWSVTTRELRSQLRRDQEHSRWALDEKRWC